MNLRDKLIEFLSTASADHATARDEAKAHEETVYSKITSNHAMQFASITGMLDALESYANSQTPTETELVPGLPTTIGALCRGALNTLNSAEGKFAIEPGTDEGDLNRAALAELQAAGVLQAGHVQGFLSLGEESVKPFENITLHDVLLMRNACPSLTLTTKGQWVTIQVPAGQTLEKHNPRLLAHNPRTGQWQRIANVMGVSEPGNYDCQVPMEWRRADLAIDNPYQVLVEVV